MNNKDIQNAIDVISSLAKKEKKSTFKKIKSLSHSIDLVSTWLHSKEKGIK